MVISAYTSIRIQLVKSHLIHGRMLYPSEHGILLVQHTWQSCAPTLRKGPETPQMPRGVELSLNPRALFATTNSSLRTQDCTDTTMLARWPLVRRLVAAPGPHDTMAAPHEQMYLTNRVTFPTNCAATVDAATNRLFLLSFTYSETKQHSFYGV